MANYGVGWIDIKPDFAGFDRTLKTHVVGELDKLPSAAIKPDFAKFDGPLKSHVSKTLEPLGAVHVKPDMVTFSPTAKRHVEGALGQLGKVSISADMAQFGAVKTKIPDALSGLGKVAVTGDMTGFGGVRSKIQDELAGAGVVHIVPDVSALSAANLAIRNSFAGSAIGAAEASTLAASAAAAAKWAAPAGANSLAGALASGVGATARMLPAALPSAPVLGAGAGLAVAGIGLKVASDAEQNLVSLTKMIGGVEQAKKHLVDLKVFNLETPFTLPGLVDASKMIMRAGFATQEVIPILKALGDATLGDEEKFGRAAYALSQMMNKGKVQGQDMMQMNEAGVPALRALQYELGVTSEELNKMMEAGKIAPETLVKALQRTDGPMASFSGAMQDQSKTMVGILSNVKDFATQGLGELFTPIFEGLKSMFLDLFPIVSTILKVVLAPLAIQLKAVGLWITVASSAWKKAWEAISSVIQYAWDNVIQPIWRGIFWLWENVLSNVFTALKTAWEATWNAIAAALSWVWNTIIQPIWNAIAAVWENFLKPIFLVMATIMAIPFAILAGVVWATWNVVIKPIWEAMIWVWDTLLKPAFEAIGVVFKAVWDAIGAGIGFVWNSLILPVWNAIMWVWNNALKPVIEAIGTVFKTVWDAVGNAIQWVWEHVIQPAWDGIKQGVEELKGTFETLKQVWQTVWDKMGDILKVAIRGIGNIVAGFFHVIGKIAGLLKLPFADEITGYGDKADTWGEAEQGGIRGASGSTNIAMFAAGGMLPTQAKIQAQGTLVQWAEPSTLGESFIPLAPSKRERSTQIWRETGRRLGVTSFEDGGILTTAGSWLAKPFEFIMENIAKGAKGIIENVWPILPTPDNDLMAMLPGGVNKLRGGVIDWLQGFIDRGELAPAAGGLAGNLQELFYSYAPTWITSGQLRPKGSHSARLISGHYDHVHAGVKAGLTYHYVTDYLDALKIPHRETSTLRPGAITSSGKPSLHGFGRAADMVGPGASGNAFNAGTMRIFNALFGGNIATASPGFNSAIDRVLPGGSLRGKISSFGGPSEFQPTAYDGSTAELYRSRYPYAAMYDKKYARKWVNISYGGRTTRAHILDHGPAPWTGRIIDVAPYVMDAIGARTDSVVDISGLANGGLTTRAGLAHVDPSEIHLPLQNAATIDVLSKALEKALRERSGRGGVTVNAVTNASPKAIADEIAWQLR